MRTFTELSSELQTYLNYRFSNYDMDAEYMYDHSDIFSDNVKSLSDLDILSFMDKKDISHILPKSRFPELTDEPTNVFLEDFAINRSRGAEIVSPEEIRIAMHDQIEDTFDLDIDEDGILDLSGYESDFGDDFDFFDWEDFDFSEILFG